MASRRERKRAETGEPVRVNLARGDIKIVDVLVSGEKDGGETCNRCCGSYTHRSRYYAWRAEAQSGPGLHKSLEKLKCAGRPLYKTELCSRMKEK